MQILPRPIVFSKTDSGYHSIPQPLSKPTRNRFMARNRRDVRVSGLVALQPSASRQAVKVQLTKLRNRSIVDERNERYDVREQNLLLQGILV
jgi:hypothetical protein